MHLREYCQQAMRTARFPWGPQPYLYPLVGLAGEVGELVNNLKKNWRDGTPVDYEAVAEELGDVLWYLAALAVSLGLDIEQIATANLEKLAKRYGEGNRELGANHEQHPQI